MLRIRDVYPGSRILIFTHPGSRISDPGSRIQKQQQKTGVKIFFCQTVFCSHKFHNWLFYFWYAEEKNLAQFSKNYGSFYPKNCHQALKNVGLGSGIRDPGSGKNLFRIPDPGVKKAPDPGSGSATLEKGYYKFFEYHISVKKEVLSHLSWKQCRRIMWNRIHIRKPNKGRWFGRLPNLEHTRYSVVDTDPHGPALLLPYCIRIRMNPYWEGGSGSRTKEMDQNMRIILISSPS